MRARLHTMGKDLGIVDLVDGVDARDVCEAVRQHRLFCTPIVAPPPEVTAPVSEPIDSTLAAGEAASNRGPGAPRRKGGAA